MQRTLTLLTVLGCLAPASAHAAWTCESAHNLAENSMRLYVSQVFGKVQRGEATPARAHDALLFVLANQTMRPTESREIKLCYDQGLWDGVTGQLAVEYEVSGLACLERPMLAAYAGAILHAVAVALRAGDAFELADAQTLFHDPQPGSGVPLCSAQPAEECAAALRGQAGPVALARYGAVVDGLASALCAPQAPSDDAGAGESSAEDAGAPDAGVSGPGLDGGID